MDRLSKHNYIHIQTCHDVNSRAGSAFYEPIHHAFSPSSFMQSYVLGEIGWLGLEPISARLRSVIIMIRLMKLVEEKTRHDDHMIELWKRDVIHCPVSSLLLWWWHHILSRWCWYISLKDHEQTSNDYPRRRTQHIYVVEMKVSANWTEPTLVRCR